MRPIWLTSFRWAMTLPETSSVSGLRSCEASWLGVCCAPYAASAHVALVQLSDVNPPALVFADLHIFLDFFFRAHPHQGYIHQWV